MFPPVRTRVLAEIEAAGTRPRVLGIVAPVGYGKTVLMTSFFADLKAQGEACFWTALDDRDNSIERVLVLLEEMAYRHSEQLHPTQALFRGDEPLESRIDRLVEAAAGYSRPFTAFVDNLDSCSEDGLGHVLDRLLFETPETVRFVFSSTAELPLNLARAKLEGLIRQIGYPELSLNRGETAELLGAELGAAIGDDGIEAVMRQTEGWPAAVRLVQIVLTASDQPHTLLEKFSGADEDLAALLNRQVLSGFPAELRQFLLDIAPLRSFCADLCRHASGNGDAERHLALLLKRNVFVIPLDRNRTWYRLHGLFREYLLGEAERTLAAPRRQKVLARAAEWCEENGYRREAVDYALAAGASAAASRILDRTATEFVRNRGDIPQYIAWVEACHARRWTLGWATEYWYIWALVMHRRYDYARQQMQRLARHLGRAQSTGDDGGRLGDVQRQLDIIKVCLDVFTDRLADAQRNAEQWLAGSATDDPFDVTAARCVQSIYFSSAFMFVEAREAAQAAQASAFQTGSAYARGWIVALSALPPILEGNYALIHPELTAALATLRATLGEGAGICGTVALLGAQCAVEMGRDDEARTLLTLGMRTSQVHGFVDAVACGLDAAVKLWRGGGDDPFSIAQLREIAGSYPPRLGLMLSCFLVRRLLQLDRREEAREEAAHIGLLVDGTAVTKPVAVARARDAFVAAEIGLCLAGDQHKRAETLIAEETRRARAEGRAARLVELALDEAALAAQIQNSVIGNRHLTRAISLAAVRGIVRPFNDRAAMIATLVEDTKPSEWGFALAQERRFFAEICRRLPISDRSLQDKLVLLNLETRLLDPLTKRQLELLSLLDAGLSNQQVADRIHVTLTTVKGHLQKLYAKLGVSSRAAALARARALNLL
jgi:LuxR family maltose regulon positive regulatory protein